MNDSHKHGVYRLLSNRPIARDIYQLVLEGDTSQITAPGQFVNIALPGFYLRRPISICDWTGSTLTLIYKVVGKGTAAMAALAPGVCLDLLTGLGNGFDIGACAALPAGSHVAVIGGGVGVPPMYGVAKALKAAGVSCSAVLGFNEAEGAFLQDRFEALDMPVYVTTVDGSLGIRGFVTDALKTFDYDYYLACGPAPMLKALLGTGKKGQISMEERMGCGFGACMGCSIHTADGGHKRVCADGPVFLSEEVLL